jgi:hypothetical protein
MPGINYSAHQFNPIAQGHGEAIKAAKADSQGFSFKDLLDVINPLQHLPVVSVIYRHLTGDTITPAAKVVGDTAYGGPIGLATSLGDLLFQDLTGKGVGDTVYAMVTGDDTSTVGSPTGYAAAGPEKKPAEQVAAAAPSIPEDPRAPLAAPTTPVEVIPAIAEPSLRGVTQTVSDTVSTLADETGQQAVKAYRAAGRLLAAY